MDVVKLLNSLEALKQRTSLCKQNQAEAQRAVASSSAALAQLKDLPPTEELFAAYAVAIADNKAFSAACVATAEAVKAESQAVTQAAHFGGLALTKLAFPSSLEVSPTSENGLSFLYTPFVGMIEAPVTVAAVDPTLAGTFKGVLAAGRKNRYTDPYFMGLATSYLPSFVEKVAHPSGDEVLRAMSSCAPGTLHPPYVLGTPVWYFPSRACKPEMRVRAAVGGPAQPAHCPAFNGQLMSMGENGALQQAVIHTTLDMVRVFFPAPRRLEGPVLSPSTPPTSVARAAAFAAAANQRLFYTHPPIGYALVGHPPVAYLLALEWVGKLLVSHASQPFFLGSPQHAAAVAALPSQHYSPPEVLDLTTAQPWLTEKTSEESLIAWCVHEGTFRKLVRGGARSGAEFASMYAAYTALARVLPGAPPHLNLPSSARLLFGVHEVLVEMPAVMGRPARERELVGELLGTVARAIAWLAGQGVIYTDLRAPNVLVDGAGRGWLVDFDDCMVVPTPVTTLEGYHDALKASPGAQYMNTFATCFGDGYQVEIEEALGKAFTGVEALGEVTSLAALGEVKSEVKSEALGEDKVEVKSGVLLEEVNRMALGEAKSVALEKVVAPERVTLGEVQGRVQGKVEREGECRTQ